MISTIRSNFNKAFSEKTYQDLLDWIAVQYNHRPVFRIAESPIFLENDFVQKLLRGSEDIVDVVVAPDFLEKSKSALLAGQVVPNETPHTIFLQMDFGICEDEDGNLSPQLIETQGFPSLYFFQDLLANAYRKFYDIPEGYSHLFGGLNSETYLERLRKIIVGDHKPEEVVLLEVEPEKQVTQIDFIIASATLGIKTLCVTKVKKSGLDLYYEDNGRKIPIRRIVNRVIFDELIKRDDLKREFYFTQDANVEWISHPNWFFRISKHTLPLIDSPYSPPAFLLSEVDKLPDDLHNYVLKPLYSFAGSGVMLNLNKHDLNMISDPENYILQRKVKYAPVIETPDGPAKAEVRMMMLWERGTARPYMVNNLVRLSKGAMVGVRYNKDKTWVGGSVGFMKTY